jgi:hypothetical protein
MINKRENSQVNPTRAHVRNTGLVSPAAEGFPGPRVGPYGRR